MKNVLIPTDFSENSKNAIKYAFLHFSNMEVNFYLLHISPVHTGKNKNDKPSEILAYGDYTLKTSGQMLEIVHFCKRSTINPKHRFFSLEENNLFVDGIRNCIVQNNIDYIVMSAKGFLDRKNLAIGSKTNEVITKVKCPVIIVPEEVQYTITKTIVLLVDLTMFYTSKVLENLMETLVMTKAVLRILFISNIKANLSRFQQKSLEFLKIYLGDITYSIHFIIAENLENGLQFFIEKQKADMVALVAKNLNFLHYIVVQPTSTENTFKKKIPLLVLHD